MTEPIRHRASERNRRKAMKLCRDLQDELLHLYTEHMKLRSNLEYAIGRTRRVLNRLQAETE